MSFHWCATTAMQSNNNKIPLVCHFSSIYARESYVGFFIDWLIEVGAAVQGTIVVITSLSLYIGLCAYTKAMVDDLKSQTRTINGALLPKQDAASCMASELAVSNEIKFHCDITV